MTEITIEPVTDQGNDHFIVRFDGPGRIEVSGSSIIAFAYSGTEDDLDQEPDGSYFSQ